MTTAGPLPRSPARPDDCAIRRVRDEWGWMSNMSPHPLNFDGGAYRTAEHLFPAGRPERSLIRREPSPMSAKMVAHRLRLQAKRGGLRDELGRTWADLRAHVQAARRAPCRRGRWSSPSRQAGR